MESGELNDLLQRVRAGDRQAFDQLFAGYREELHRFVDLRLDHKLRARLDASDIVQEAQLEAYRRIEDYLQRQPMPFGLWLCKTTYERLLKARRRHLQTARRGARQEIGLPERSSMLLARQLVSAGTSPSRQLSRKETARIVSEAVARLSEDDREILVMRNFEEREYGEIAQLLEIEAAAARKRYGRALLRLQRALAEAGVLES